MRYHFEKPEHYEQKYGTVYECNHPVYSKCTLYKVGLKGLAVIQQRFCQETKSTYWTEIDPWLVDSIYLNTKFIAFFKERANVCVKGLYPTVTVRQIMWKLKMKPIPKQLWETVFDRSSI